MRHIPYDQTERKIKISVSRQQISFSQKNLALIHPKTKTTTSHLTLETLHSTTEEDKGQSNYVCGWVVAKCFRKITKLCKICKSNLNEKCEVEENALIRAKEFNKRNKWLCYPNKNVIEVFKEIQSITCSFQKKDVPKYGLQKMMCDTLIKYPFTCTTHQADLKAYFVDITIKVLIYSWCINRILKGKIRYDETVMMNLSCQLIYILRNIKNIIKIENKSFVFC